jgi:hypothetical protein
MRAHRLKPNRFYFCGAGKKANLGKIQNHCAPKGCPKLHSRPRKNLAPNLVKITAAQTANAPLH